MRWQTIKLKDLCEVFDDGNWIETKDQSNSGIRLIQTGNIKKGIFANRENKSRYISEKTFIELKCREIFPGDLLVSRLPDPVGRACIIPNLNNRLITSVDCTIIRVKKNILPKYLNYLMQSSEYFSNINKNVSGATRQRISKKNLGEILIPVPALDEQKNIIEKLDKIIFEINKEIELTKKKQIQANVLFQNILNSEIIKISSENNILKLNEVAKFIDYRGKTPTKTKDGIKLLTAKNVRMGYIRNEPEEFISHEEYKSRMTRGFPRKGDVVITTEAPLGLIAQIENEKVSPGQRLITLQVKNNIIENKYLKFLLMSQHYQKIILDKGTGATVLGIKASLLKNIEITFPTSIEEQNIRCAKIEVAEIQTKKLIDIYEKKLTDLNRLKSSLFNKEFKKNAI